MSDIVQRLISAAEDFPEIDENPSDLYCAASVEIQHLRARLAAAEAQAASAVPEGFPKATAEQAAIGWTLDCDYLRWVRARAGGAITLEDVEDILLAVAPQQGGGEDE